MDSSLDHGPLSVPEADRLPSRELGNERPTSIGHKGTSKMKEEESKHGNSMNSQRGKYQDNLPSKKINLRLLNFDFVTEIFCYLKSIHRRRTAQFKRSS